MKNTLNMNVAVYFRGCLSEHDNRYCVMAAGINGKPDELGRKITSLSISLDGETIMDYDLKRDDCPFEVIDWIYRAFFDGTLWDKLGLTDDRKTALYCRIASNDIFTLESQVITLYKYGEDKGYNLYAAYCDNAESGISLNRPCLQKLIADIRSNEVKRVAVSNLSRLSRNYTDIHKLFRLFIEHDVELVSLGDDGVVDIAESQKFMTWLNEIVRIDDKTSRTAKSI